MVDTVVIPLGPLGVLELPRDVFDRHLRPIAATAPARSAAGVEELVTARELARMLSLPISCIYEYAKADRIPCVRAGKHVRFNPAAVMAALRSTGSTTVGQR